MGRKRRSKQKQRLLKRLGRLLWIGAAVTGALGLFVFTWHWTSTLPLKEVQVSGARHASVEEIRELARVDSVETLYSVRPQLIADRVSRHAWVAQAHVRRIPTGTLRVRVTEREPVVLVMDARGRPAWYLDAKGYSVPLVDGVVYDLPLLRGLSAAYNPRQPVESSSLLAFLGAIRDSDDSVTALISEVHVAEGGDISVYTTPADARGAVHVRLGRDGYGVKLQRLRSFWDQAVLAKKEKTFSLIDLRFENQIVTREETRKN